MAIPELFQKDEDNAATLKAYESEPIDVVSVCKYVDGARKSIPRKYEIQELSTAEQLYGQLGAGSYELIGRSVRGTIVRRCKHVIDNPPGYQPPEPKVMSQPVIQQAPPSMGDSSILVAIIQLMGQQMQATNAMVQGMLQMNSQNANAHVQSMGQMFSTFGTAQTALLEKVMSVQGNKDPENLFLKGVETAAELRRGAEEGRGEESGGGLTETLQAVGQGVALAQSIGLIPGAPAPQSAPVVPTS